jgi:hypothetical protein
VAATRNTYIQHTRGFYLSPSLVVFT